MPPFLDFGEDEEDGLDLKFDGCGTCANRRKPRVCRGCEVGEEFEEEEPEGLDSIFRN